MLRILILLLVNIVFLVLSEPFRQIRNYEKLNTQISFYTEIEQKNGKCLCMLLQGIFEDENGTEVIEKVREQIKELVQFTQMYQHQIQTGGTLEYNDAVANSSYNTEDPNLDLKNFRIDFSQLLLDIAQNYKITQHILLKIEDTPQIGEFSDRLISYLTAKSSRFKIASIDRGNQNYCAFIYKNRQKDQEVFRRKQKQFAEKNVKSIQKKAHHVCNTLSMKLAAINTIKYIFPNQQSFTRNSLQIEFNQTQDIQSGQYLNYYQALELSAQKHLYQTSNQVYKVTITCTGSGNQYVNQKIPKKIKKNIKTKVPLKRQAGKSKN